VILSSSSCPIISNKAEKQGAMRRYGLIGFPLGHSFSKKYFTGKFLKEEIHDVSYELYPMEEINQLPALIASDPELKGLNVTIPHKTKVIDYLDALDEVSTGAGAVNVIKIFRAGADIRLKGFNSDVFGITESIRPYVTDKEINALILGTGGSSRL
jgi:shikimate dehydrogenase